MGALQSQEMRHAIYLYEQKGKTRTEASRIAGVTLSGLCKALKDKGIKKHLRRSNNSTKVS